jgi:nucleoid-associated protein YgaU
MATLATPTASSIAPAVAFALDQSSFVDTSLNTRALDCSLNASMDCSLNGSFSDVRQSKPKPVVVATLADKARRDAEKKAAELESASALRLDSEAKHKAALERRLQLEEENRRRLEEAEKAKREREAAKQAAVKVQLDEEQRRRREEEKKRKREKDSAAAALEEAKRKEQAQARAIQKVPASLVATCSAPSSSSLETAMQRQAMFSPKQGARIPHGADLYILPHCAHRGSSLHFLPAEAGRQLVLVWRREEPHFNRWRCVASPRRAL